MEELKLTSLQAFTSSVLVLRDKIKRGLSKKLFNLRRNAQCLAASHTGQRRKREKGLYQFLVDELIIIRPHTLQVRLDLIIVLAHVRRIPAITARVVVREGGGLALECCVGGTEHSLAHVGDAVDHVPVVVLGDLVTG